MNTQNQLNGFPVASGSTLQQVAGLPILRGYDDMLKFYLRGTMDERGQVGLSIRKPRSKADKTLRRGDTSKPSLEVLVGDVCGLRVYDDNSIDVMGPFSSHEYIVFKFFIENIWDGLTLRHNHVSGIIVEIDKRIASEESITRAFNELGQREYSFLTALTFCVTPTFKIVRVTNDTNVYVTPIMPTYKIVADKKVQAEARAEVKEFIKFTKIFQKIPMPPEAVDSLRAEFNKSVNLGERWLDRFSGVSTAGYVLEMLIDNPQDRSLWPVVVAAYHRCVTKTTTQFDSGRLKSNIYQKLYKKHNAYSYQRNPYGVIPKGSLREIDLDKTIKIEGE